MDSIYFYVLFSCSIVFCSGYSARNRVCGENEEIKECTNICDNDACPSLIDQNQEPCISPAVCGPPQCQCKENFRRDSRGVCVPIADCGNGLPKCNAPNEVLSCVQDCPPERTCRNRGIQFSCLQSNKRCQLKCVCKEGYFRNAIGECITGKECDQCADDNEYFSCGPECDNVCADLATQNKTNCPIINIQCNRKCYCDDGFARDAKKKCVPIDQCPKENVCADPNEKFSTCKSTCPPDLCFSLVARFKCPACPKCEPGCSCKPGFLRIKEGSPCVPICSCPEMKNSRLFGLYERINY